MNSHQLTTVFALIFCCGFCQARGRPEPPTSEDIRTLAITARQIIHKTNWVAIGSISIRAPFVGYPYTALKSISDGPVGNSTGIPYLYVTDLDVSSKDFKVNNSATIMASKAEKDESACPIETIDPQDPRCARIMLIGKFLPVDKDSEEYNFAENALFSRHTAMKRWPNAGSHNFYVAKLDVLYIEIMAGFGGLITIPKDVYFSVNVTNTVNAGL